MKFAFYSSVITRIIEKLEELNAKQSKAKTHQPRHMCVQKDRWAMLNGPITRAPPPHPLLTLFSFLISYMVKTLLSFWTTHLTSSLSLSLSLSPSLSSLFSPLSLSTWTQHHPHRSLHHRHLNLRQPPRHT